MIGAVLHWDWCFAQSAGHIVEGVCETASSVSEEIDEMLYSPAPAWECLARDGHEGTL